MASASHTPKHFAFDRPPQKRFTKPFMAGLVFASLLHIGLAIYLVNERFELKIFEAPPPPITKGQLITLTKPPEPKPIDQVTPRPETPVILHQPITTITTPPTTLNAEPVEQTGDKPYGPVTSLGGEAGPVSTPDTKIGPSYVKAVWSRFPDSRALMEYYPSKAEAAEAEGKVTLACTVIDTKGRVKCAVVDETPKGYEFGEAAVRVVEAKGRADTAKGAVEVGSIMRLQMLWTLN
jgi:periplasmic protein TonB